MGWLRDLMQAADPAFRSYDALARATLAHPAWPDQTRPQPRSLAAIFSKLDRNLDTDWLADREGVQRVLADALDCPVADLRAAIERPRMDPQAAVRRLRIREVRRARALDPTEEDLCPGLPEIVLNPAAWGRLWWSAPTGSGRTLAGQWLAARGLAAFVAAHTWADARPQLPSRGAVFVELHAAADPQARLDGLPRTVCIAAPGAPPDRCGPWSVVESPPVEQYLDALVDWVSRRLPQSGRFDPTGTKRWLREGSLAELGMVDRLATVLGLCGVVDELGLDRVRGRTATELAARFFARRIAEVAERHDAGWLKRSGFVALVGLAKRTLTDSDTPWHEARRFDDWLDLVPIEHRQGADLEWMHLSLLDERSPVRPSDIERAAQRMPLGAYRVVRALCDAHLLASGHRRDELALRPQWFAQCLVAEARRALIDSSPFEWGEALLRPHAGSAIADAVGQRVARGDSSVIESVLDLEADDSPALVAALEVVFEAAGLAVLEGVELPQEQVEALWNEQLRLAMQLPSQLPIPRIEHPPGHVHGRHHGRWLLAALALSEQLAAGDAVRHSLLRPWDESVPPAGMRALYDQVHAAALDPFARWAPYAFALADRLRAAIGGVSPPRLHPLERPGAILEEIEHDVLGWDTVSGLGDQPRWVEALVWMAERRGLDWSRVAEAIWASWRAAPAGADGGDLLDPGGEYAARFWPTVPPAVLRARVTSPSARPTSVPYAVLASDRWPGVIEELSSLPSAVRADPGLWAALPPELFELALERLEPAEPSALSALWQRFPERMPGLLDAWLDADRPEPALALLAAAPPQHAGVLLQRLEPTVRDALPALVNPLRSWLRKFVGRRDPDWRRAYALLAMIERDLRRTGS